MAEDPATQFIEPGSKVGESGTSQPLMDPVSVSLPSWYASLTLCLPVGWPSNPRTVVDPGLCLCARPEAGGPGTSRILESDLFGAS